MTQITQVGTQSPVQKKVKITNISEIANEVIQIEGNCLRNNPNASDDELRVAIRNELQGKISPKKLAQFNSETIITAVRQNIQNATSHLQTVSIPTTLEQIPSSSIRSQYMPFEQKAANYYYNELPTTNKGWQRRHKKELQNVQSAFKNEQQYMEYLQRVSPQTYQEEKTRMSQEPSKESNNAGKKQANAEYISSKKRKQKKNIAETSSRQEHKQQRVIKDKSQRNAIYVTQQGQMTTNARETFNYTEQMSQRTSENMFKNNITQLEQNVLRTNKSAEEAARVFEKNGYYAINTSSPRTGRKFRSGVSTSSFSPISSAKPFSSSENLSVVDNTVKPETTKPLEEGIKPKPSNGGHGGKGGSGKYWLIAAITIGLGMLGYGIYSKHKKQQAQNK